jgi:HK97 family phage prohead protease
MPDENKQHREQRSFPCSAKLELRAGDNGQQRLTGYFIEWEQKSNPIWGYFREKFAKGAFRNLDSPDICALWQHDQRQPLARQSAGTLILQEDSVGVRFDFEVDPEISWHRDAIRSIQRGDVTQMSFMFTVPWEEGAEIWDESDPSMPVRTVHKADLYEISPVTWAAYPQTTVGVRSAEEVFESFAGRRNKPARDISLLRKKLDLIMEV